MSKHTPGPWEIRVHLSASENHKGFSICAPIHNGWTLAEVRPGDQDGKMGHANARLIAAAPTLLEELRKCIRLIDGEVPGSAIRAIEQATGGGDGNA